MRTSQKTCALRAEISCEWKLAILFPVEPIFFCCGPKTHVLTADTDNERFTFRLKRTDQ